MSVAKNTLVSGSREKSLEIMFPRPPPQAARTSVCDRLSRDQSSRRRTSARSSPKPTLRSSPFPRLRCPVNVQPIALFYTVGHLLHRRSATLRYSDCRQPVVNGIRLCCAFQSELRLFPREALSSPAAFLQSAAISGKRAGGIRYAGPDTLNEARQRPYASDTGTATPLNPSSSSPRVDAQPSALTRPSSERRSLTFVIVCRVNASRGVWRDTSSAESSVKASSTLPLAVAWGSVFQPTQSPTPTKWTPSTWAILTTLRSSRRARFTVSAVSAARFSIGLLASSMILWLLPMLSTPSRPSSGPILNASLPGARSRNPRLASVAARRDALLLSTPSIAAISFTRYSWLTSSKRRSSRNARSTG